MIRPHLPDVWENRIKALAAKGEIEASETGGYGRSWKMSKGGKRVFLWLDSGSVNYKGTRARGWGLETALEILGVSDENESR